MVKNKSIQPIFPKASKKDQCQHEKLVERIGVIAMDTFGLDTLSLEGC